MTTKREFLEALDARTGGLPNAERERLIDYVTDLIDEARKQRIHLVFLWFASWKNGAMEYCPAWVKRDKARSPRFQSEDKLGRAAMIRDQ